MQLRVVRVVLRLHIAATCSATALLTLCAHHVCVCMCLSACVFMCVCSSSECMPKSLFSSPSYNDGLLEIVGVSNIYTMR
jgi:hypothetical protein